MFPIRGISTHITQQLDTVVTVLKKYRGTDGTIVIEETESNDRKGNNNQEPLTKVTISNIPKHNVWIFENEFNHIPHTDHKVNIQKGAFTSAGNKVEKSIILHKGNRLYIVCLK